MSRAQAGDVNVPSFCTLGQQQQVVEGDEVNFASLVFLLSIDQRHRAGAQQPARRLVTDQRQRLEEQQTQNTHSTVIQNTIQCVSIFLQGENVLHRMLN